MLDTEAITEEERLPRYRKEGPVQSDLPQGVISLRDAEARLEGKIQGINQKIDPDRLHVESERGICRRQTPEGGKLVRFSEANSIRPRPKERARHIMIVDPDPKMAEKIETFLRHDGISGYRTELVPQAIDQHDIKKRLFLFRQHKDPIDLVVIGQHQEEPYFRLAANTRLARVLSCNQTEGVPVIGITDNFEEVRRYMDDIHHTDVAWRLLNRNEFQGENPPGLAQLDVNVAQMLKQQRFKAAGDRDVAAAL